MRKIFVDPEDAAVVLVDHQSGLFQTVKDIDVQRLRTNVMALVKAAKLLNLPVITTSSAADGPNGPFMPEIAQILPEATSLRRNGEVNAWDMPDFADAVRGTGRKTLLIAGVWTSVCLAFPALSAAAEGFDVYAVIDASGDVSTTAQQVTVARLVQAGIGVTNTHAIIAELQKTWNRSDAADYAAIYASIAPNYGAVIESFYSGRG